jgi:thioredoxin 1
MVGGHPPRRRMAAAYKRSTNDRIALQASIASRDLLVIGLCAAWCNTCGEFLDAFESVARESPGATFLWLDIEDDADLVGDVEVENFPTLAIFDRSRAIHFGVSLPQASLLSRLVRTLGPESRTVPVDASVKALPEAIEQWAAGQP